MDYLAIKRLANKLWQGDASDLQVHDLADLILAQPRVGTTVKCDGKESDPYAVLSVINLRVHKVLYGHPFSSSEATDFNAKDRPFVKALIDYVLDKSASNSALQSSLKDLLRLQSSNCVGFIFSERLINMPVQLVPPMYRMLQEEMQWATNDVSALVCHMAAFVTPSPPQNKPFRFSHYLFLSQTYKLSAAEAAELETRPPPAKKPKGSSASKQNKTFSVHPEDDQITQVRVDLTPSSARHLCISPKFASHTVEFGYTTAVPRDSESFGLDTGGKLMLLPAERLPQFISAIEAAYPAPRGS